MSNNDPLGLLLCIQISYMVSEEQRSMYDGPLKKKQSLPAVDDADYSRSDCFDW